MFCFCVDWTVDDWFTQWDDVAQIHTTGFTELYKLLIPSPNIILSEYKFVVSRSSVSDTAWISSAEFHQCLVIHNFSVAVAGCYEQYIFSSRACSNARHVGRQFPQEPSWHCSCFSAYLSVYSVFQKICLRQFR